jgi:hypothetical protein
MDKKRWADPQQIETSPSSSTARQSQNRQPAITTAISSRCHHDIDRSAQPLLGTRF